MLEKQLRLEVWIYEVNLKPSLTYAVVVWGKRVEKKPAQVALEKLRELLLRRMIGKARSTLTAALGCRTLTKLRKCASRQSLLYSRIELLPRNSLTRSLGSVFPEGKTGIPTEVNFLELRLFPNVSSAPAVDIINAVAEVMKIFFSPSRWHLKWTILELETIKGVCEGSFHVLYSWHPKIMVNLSSS